MKKDGDYRLFSFTSVAFNFFCYQISEAGTEKY